MHPDYVVGEVVQLSTEITDVKTQTLVDPDDLTLTIQAPSADLTTVLLESLQKNAVGQYSYDLNLTQPGIWAFRWEGTGQNESVSQGVIKVDKSVIREIADE